MDRCYPSIFHGREHCKASFFPLPMTPDDLKSLMRRLSLWKTESLATLAEVDARVAEAWLAGRRPIPVEVAVALNALPALNDSNDPPVDRKRERPSR